MIKTQHLLDLGFEPCYLKDSYEYHFKNTIFVDQYGTITICNGITKKLDAFDLAKLMLFFKFD